MSQNKTQATGTDVPTFLHAVEPPGRREDALQLDALFRRVTGFTPRLWGPSIIGYGAYHYVYDSGREGDFLATGFAPRKANMVVYIMPGYSDFSDILQRLGPHKLGKSCLYLGRLSQVDQDVLAELIRAGLDDLNTRWPVRAEP
ncbi:DUF1801 domain-containing protein [Pacificoceanicola onchidii]|uniref:DUF1801 domain-containing protein n=1 Tax=Pacificoceanicola onchidii TaxID=2562685 RepID=UPI0010A3DCD2|nr:DUF1801 domain-containing protein [Pacificoceanicola onchidii]